MEQDSVCWDPEQVDIKVAFHDPRDNAAIASYEGKAQIGQLRGSSYLLLPENDVSAHKCFALQGTLCDKAPSLRIKASVEINGQTKEGFVDQVGSSQHAQIRICVTE